MQSPKRPMVAQLATVAHQEQRNGEAERRDDSCVEKVAYTTLHGYTKLTH